MLRIGLLGGTFDPPHLGHLVVAEVARDALDLDGVRLLVAGDPWMKDRQLPAVHRVAMCQAAVTDHPQLSVDDRETRHHGPTYTADTLAALHRDEPGVAWTFVMGADAAAELPGWHRIDEALALADWVVVGRPGDGWPDHPLADRLTRVEVPGMDLASSDVRDRVAAGRTIRYLVPEPVRDYIRAHGLYRHSGP